MKRLEFKRRGVEIDEDLREREQELELELKLKRLDGLAVKRLEARFGAEIPKERREWAREQPVHFRCHRHYLEHLRRDGLRPEEGVEVLGDHHPASGEIYVDAERRGLLKTLAHERLHQVSDKRFRALLGERLDEGMTEHLAEEATAAAGWDGEAFPDGARVYPREKRLIEELGARFGDAPLKRAYFQGDWQGLHERVNRELGDGALERLVDLAEAEQYDEAESLIRYGL